MSIHQLEGEKLDLSAPASASRQPVLRVARFPAAIGRNPYFQLLYDALRDHGVEFVAEPPLSVRTLRRARKELDVLHFHWRPDKYYSWPRPMPKDPDSPPPRSQNFRSWLRLVGFACRLKALRFLGYRVVWTIHEVYPPETITRPPGSVSRRIDRIGSRLLARASDLLLAHDAATAARARTELGRSAARVEIVAHSSYIGVYPAGRPRADVRQALGIPPAAFAFLCFGALRPEKSIELVLDAFCSIDDPNVALVVAGTVEDAASRRSVLAAAERDGRIVPMLKFVPHDQVRELFDAVDVAVLGRSEVWTSGSLILALSLGVPVVAAELPPYDELLAGGEAGWLFRPGDVTSLRDTMQQAASDPSLAKLKGLAALRQAQRLPSWPEVGERTAALIVQACTGRRSAARASALP